ncbi:hypothetical protein ACUH92_08910 [Dermabacteraceae bacterium CCM 9520]
MNGKQTDSELAYIGLGVVGLGALLWFTRKGQVLAWLHQVQAWLIGYGVLVPQERALVAFPGGYAGIDLPRILILLGMLVLGIRLLFRRNGEEDA